MISQRNEQEKDERDTGFERSLDRPLISVGGDGIDHAQHGRPTWRLPKGASRRRFRLPRQESPR